MPQKGVFGGRNRNPDLLADLEVVELLAEDSSLGETLSREINFEEDVEGPGLIDSGNGGVGPTDFVAVLVFSAG